MAEQRSRRTFLSTLMTSVAGVWVLCSPHDTLAEGPKVAKYGGPMPRKKPHPATKYGGRKKEKKESKKSED
jgi:hypothetical protein